MPIYEYQCKTCGNSFEKLFFKGDDEQVVCPECGDDKVKKLLSAGSFMHKTGIGVCSAGSPKGFS